MMITIQDVISMYDEAERLIDKASACLIPDTNRIAGVSIQPVNELRYAGRHICRAIKKRETSGELDQDELVAAMSHCRRSCYDSADALLKYALANCMAFLEDYRLVPTVDKVACIPSLVEDRHRLDELNSLQRTREDANRDSAWEDQMRYGEEATQILHRFEQGRELLNDLLIEEQRSVEQDKEFKQSNKIQTVATVIGVVAGVIAAVITTISGIIVIVKALLGTPI